MFPTYGSFTKLNEDKCLVKSVPLFQQNYLKSGAYNAPVQKTRCGISLCEALEGVDLLRIAKHLLHTPRTTLLHIAFIHVPIYYMFFTYAVTVLINHHSNWCGIRYASLVQPVDNLGCNLRLYIMHDSTGHFSDLAFVMTERKTDGLIQTNGQTDRQSFV